MISILWGIATVLWMLIGYPFILLFMIIDAITDGIMWVGDWLSERNPINKQD